MKHLGTFLKGAATVALLWFIFSRVDIEELAARVTSAQIAAALALGAIVLSLQAVMVALRLRVCLRMFGQDTTVASSWVACQYAGFFSHTPISFIGGDAMRVWHLVNKGSPLGEAAKAVFMDRAVGFIGMVILVAASAPALGKAVEDPRMWMGFLLLLGTAAGGCVGFLLLGLLRPKLRSVKILRWVTEFATLSRYLWAHPVLAAQAVVLGLLVTALNLIAIWAIGLGYSAPLDLATAFAAGPAVFLIAMIPISIAGWGLREGALVVALGLFHVPVAASLTISVTYGIAVLVAYSPAPALLFLEKRAARHDADAPAA